MKRYILLVALVLVLFLYFFTKFRMNQSNPDVLLPLISKIKNNIEFRDIRKDAISKADVAWHLDHMLKTINTLTNSLETSNPSSYESSFNVPRIVALTGGIIPRGRAQSPQSVRPPEIILTKDIRTQIAIAIKNIEKLRDLDSNSNFDHPVFGMLNKAQTIRFLEVHTIHHLKIVSDILAE